MLTVDEAGSTFVVHPNGQRTHYVDDNFTDPWLPCETILIQHGFCRTSAHWYHWIPPLAGRYRVIRRELRGHGKSSVPQPSDNYYYTLDTILDEIVDTLDQLGVDKVHFFGESTSGMLGEAFAAKHPHRLHSLIISSSPTHLPQPGLDFLAFGHSSWPAACRELGSRGWAVALSSAKGTVAIDDPAYLKWWVDQVATSDKEGLAGYAQFLSTLDARPFLDSIRAPMLILAPANSALTSLDAMEALAAQVPSAKLVPIEEGGHEIYVGAPEQCQRAVLDFISDLKKP